MTSSPIQKSCSTLVNSKAKLKNNIDMSEDFFDILYLYSEIINLFHTLWYTQYINKIYKLGI